MQQTQIFIPMLGVMLLTAVVWTYMYVVRIRAMRKARRPAQTYTTPETLLEHLPEAANYPAYNLKNLFELPVLFYGLCLYLFVMQMVDTGYLVAAWLFLILRVGHSIVHSTNNVVLLRFYLYAGSACALWIMLIRATATLVITEF